MSEDASENRPWPTTPTFGDSPRGYWGYEVDRLLDELKAADAAGESLGPIIDDAKLSEVGFGYSIPEVDAHLAVLRGRRTSHTASTSPSPQKEMPGTVPSVTSPAYPPPLAPGSFPSPVPASMSESPISEAVETKPSAETKLVRNTVVESAVSSVAAFTPPPVPGAAMLAEIPRAGALPRPPGRAAGYAAADVDKFFSELADAIRADQYVLATVQSVRFDMARGGAPGYDVKEVDLLLYRLEGIASGPAAAPDPRAYQANPYDQRTVELNPYQGFSTPEGVKPGRSKSIIRTIISTAFILFVLYNFLRVWTGFGF